jgi:hypothetical protein
MRVLFQAGLAAALVVSAACGIPGNGPSMQPGRNCMECHSARGEDEAPSFNAAGTVFTNLTDPVTAGVRGVRVSLTGADGREVVLRTNEAGNFYTRERLVFPLRARIEANGIARVMSLPVPDGACNRCHDVPPRGDGTPETTPTGRVALIGGGTGDEFMSPGDHCVACHDGRAATRFTAAGTVYGSPGAAANQGVAGVTVRIRSGSGAVLKELTSNRVGNFFTSDPLPATVQVEIQQGATVRRMEDRVDSPVSCNRCHTPGGETSRVSTSGGGD